jgi:uncharacterized protein (DUF1800 family)
MRSVGDRRTARKAPAPKAPAPKAPAPSADAAVRHLLRRTSYGLTPSLVAAVPAARRSAWLAAQMQPATIKDPACDAVLGRFPALTWSISKVRAEAEAKRIDGWDVMVDLGTAAVVRAVWSERQLLEVMVDFWSNLLNITCPSSDVWDNRARFDADVIRRNAFGRYDDLLLAATTHPSMLTYLNNASSTKDAPNENLGRELLELHSVGVDAGYSEDDVQASARILTGLSIDWETGEFSYRADTHHVGPLKVLGFRHANSAADGRAVVAAYLKYLAHHSATARRICHRLAVRFVRDDPPAGLVDRLAALYLAGGTAITPVLLALFDSAEFAASVDAKVRTPYESLVASMRALGIGPPPTGTDPLRSLYWLLGDLGHQPLAWPQPNGYPDVAAAWQSTAGTLGRWNANLDLAAGWWPKGLTHQPLSALVPSPRPGTHGALVSALGARLRTRPVTSAERDALCGFLGVTASTALRADSEALTWRLPQVVALLLDTPGQLLR